MTPKTLRDTITLALRGNTDAGNNVYSGRYLPHLLNSLLSADADTILIDVNVFEREYINEDIRSIGYIGTYSTLIEAVINVTDDVIDKADQLIEQIKSVLFDYGGLLNANCFKIDGIIGVNSWTEKILINTESDKESVVVQIELEILSN